VGCPKRTGAFPLPRLPRGVERALRWRGRGDADAGTTIVGAVGVPGAEEERVDDDELIVFCHEFPDGLDRYLADRARSTGEGPRSLAEVVAFNTAHAGAELTLFGQDHLERSVATGGLGDEEYRVARARCVECAIARSIDHALDALAVLTTAPAWCIDHVNGDTFLGAGFRIAAVASHPSITVHRRAARTSSWVGVSGPGLE